jgi:hypothetical protein
MAQIDRCHRNLNTGFSLMREQPGIDRNARLGLILAFVMAAMVPLRAQTVVPTTKADKPRVKTDKAAEKAEQPTTSSEDEPSPPKPGGLRMSRAVVCKSIDGYEIYKPLAGAAQTSDEKLLIYYRPLRYKIDFVEGYYRAHLVQDNEIRKRGRREVVRQKRKVVEYEPKSKDPLGPIFIRNTISLKGLEPGEYELTIILRDEREKAAPPSRQVVPFKVIPPHDPRTKPAPTKDEDPPSDP